MRDAEKDIYVSYPGLIIENLFFILYPLALSFIWYQKFGGKIPPILIGLAGFFCGVVILESVILYFLFLIFQKITAIIIIISLISPGLFEETARYVCFYFLLKNSPIYRDKKTSVSYGIGHGGIECLYLLFTGPFIVLVAKDWLVENGGLKSDILFLGCLISCWERIFAVILHISLSVLVFKAVNEKKIYFYIVAIIIHDFVDSFALLYQYGVLNLYITELIITILAICLAVVAFKLYKNDETNYSEEKEKMITDNPENLTNSVDQSNPENPETKNPDNPTAAPEN